MKQKQKNLFIVILGALLVVGASTAAYLNLSSASRPAAKGETLVSRGSRPTRVRKSPRKRPNGPTATSKRDRHEEKPSLDFDDDSELSPEMKKLIDDLQEALDDESFARVSSIAERIQRIQREKGHDAVPAEVRSKIVEALGWFLPDSLSELVGFMADPDPEVHEDVLSQFESALDDTSIGDRDLAVIVKSMCKVLTDDDALDALFMCVESDMRNSVAVDTYKYLIKNGNDAVKKRVFESISDFACDDDVNTEAALDAWAKDPENADDEDDENFYGPDKDDD